MAEWSFGQWWKYDSGALEQTSHCCATAFQQVLVSFWYLMDKEILVSVARLVLLLAKKLRLKKGEWAQSLNLCLCWVMGKVKLRHITRQQEGSLAYWAFCFANKQGHLLITLTHWYPSHIPGHSLLKCKKFCWFHCSLTYSHLCYKSTQSHFSYKLKLQAHSRGRCSSGLSAQRVQSGNFDHITVVHIPFPSHDCPFQKLTFC